MRHWGAGNLTQQRVEAIMEAEGPAAMLPLEELLLANRDHWLTIYPRFLEKVKAPQQLASLPDLDGPRSLPEEDDERPKTFTPREAVARTGGQGVLRPAQEPEQSVVQTAPAPAEAPKQLENLLPTAAAAPAEAPKQLENLVPTAAAAPAEAPKQLENLLPTAAAAPAEAPKQPANLVLTAAASPPAGPVVIEMVCHPDRLPTRLLHENMSISGGRMVHGTSHDGDKSGHDNHPLMRQPLRIHNR
jgi:hypothetical protein